MHTVTDNLEKALRGMICASPGHKFVVTDLAGIEGRVLPWLCHNEPKLNLINAGVNMYFMASSAIYGTPYEAYLLPNGKMDKSHPEYMPGKIAELALGFQGAIGALNSMAGQFNLPEYEEKEGGVIVQGWRKAPYNTAIVKYWYNTQRAVQRAYNNPGDVYECGRIDWVLDGDFMIAVLPSGREMHYHNFQIQNGNMSHMGHHSSTHQWLRLDTYGGKLVQGCTQATARDIINANIPLAEEYKYPLVFSVHDEFVTETPDTDDYTHEELSELLATPPAWAKGLPLAAEGYESQRYRK